MNSQKQRLALNHLVLLQSLRKLGKGNLVSLVTAVILITHRNLTTSIYNRRFNLENKYLKEIS